MTTVTFLSDELFPLQEKIDPFHFFADMKSVTKGLPSIIQKFLLFLAIFCFSSSILAQVSKTVYLTAAGTLSTVLTADELNTVTNLTLSGSMDARDFNILRNQMPVLSEINLREAIIIAYTEEQGKYLPPIIFPANTIPDFAFSYKTSLVSVLLPESLTALGKYCFASCSPLNTVEIPSSVTSIGANSFDGCSELTSLAIPSSVTNIGAYAFRYCSKLASVDIPSAVTVIEKGTFSYCTSLDTLAIPSSVSKIGAYAFTNCTKLTSAVIPSSVDTIGAHAFDHCTGITSVSISSSVAFIGAYAFRYCENLSAAVIPLKVTSIEEGVFSNCTKLTSVSIPSSVTSIGKAAFLDCSNLISIDIPSSVTSIGEIAFGRCDRLTSFTIPSSVTSLADGVFFECIRLSSIVIPSSVTSIGSRAFEGSAAFIEVDENNQFYSSLEGVLYDKNKTILLQCPLSKEGSVTIPSSVTTIDHGAFMWCSKLSTVTIPSSVTTIRGKAFYGCGVTSIVIPSSVDSIAAMTFMNCTSLTSITIPSSVTAIGASAFCNCNRLPSIVIPSSVTSIGNFAFDNCESLTKIFIPSSVISIGSAAFSGCTALIEIDTNNPVYSSLNSVIYNKDKTTLIQCPTTKSGKFVIPSSVTSIESGAFWECRHLTSISIPSSVISIKNGAFSSSCYSLTSIIAANPIPIDLTSSVNIFANINKSTCTLFVPVGSKSAYQAANEWKDFINIVEDPKLPTTLDATYNEKQFTVFPNPTTGKIKVSIEHSPAKGTYLSIMDITGRIVLKQLIQNKEVQMDLSGNPPGMYFIKTGLKDQIVQRIVLK